MKYKITYLINSEYCSLKPSDTECHRSVIIEADSKAEAVMQLHEEEGMILADTVRTQARGITPEIWSIDMLV